MKHRTKIMCLGVVVALGAAACSGDGISKTEFLDELVAQNLFTQEQAECFVDRVWDDIGPLDANKITSGDLSEADQAALTAATLACIDLGGDVGVTSDLSPGDPPPGEDAVLDALWTQCGEGDAAACDTLYFDSPVGSTYEEFGLTCGGRGGGDCVEVIGASE